MTTSCKRPPIVRNPTQPLSKTLTIPKLIDLISLIGGTYRKVRSLLRRGLLRELKQRRRQRGRKKANFKWVRLAKHQLCACITLFCTFLSRRCVTTTCKCLISRFVEDGNTRQQLFSSCARTLITPAPKTFACIWHIKRVGISAITFEAARIHFLSDVFVAVAVVVSETPFYVVEVGEGKKEARGE